MTECEAVVRRLWPHLDGMLPDSERARVTRHLEECNDCRSHFDFARAFLEAVNTTHPPEREYDALRDRVLAALGSEGFAG
jgi:anti-sigma factor RsiW